MKKYLLVVIATFLLMLSLSGCTNNKLHHNNNAGINLKHIHTEYFDVEIIEDLGAGNFIIRDKNTNVLYLFVTGYQASAMTPIYNSDGKPMTYKGGAE